MKFEISAAQRGVLMAELGPHLTADENAGAGARYPVVSLYYDTAERDCYWEKARSLPSRRKLRVRIYGSRDGVVPAVSFVEIKHKCDGRGVKRRVMLPLAQALRVCDGEEPEGVTLSESDSRIIAEVHDLVKRRAFKPVMVMRYDRTAFAGAESGSDLRVTFDEGIRARLDHLTPEPDDRRFDMGRDALGGGCRNHGGEGNRLHPILAQSCDLRSGLPDAEPFEILQHARKRGSGAARDALAEVAHAQFCTRR